MREVRGKYFWLRRKLGRAKKLRAIEKIGVRSEARNDELHKVAGGIVEEAENNHRPLLYDKVMRIQGSNLFEVLNI